MQSKAKDILETAIGASGEMQCFDPESFTGGVEHSQKVKATPPVNDSGPKDCTSPPHPIAVSRIMRIGVDLMGNENSPEVLLHALQGLKLPTGVQLVVFGTPDLKKFASIEFIAAPEYITPGENPLTALRRKKDSSLCTALKSLKTGSIDALISAGNTGALVAASQMILGKTPGTLKPALLALMPTQKNPVAVLDVGANVQVKAAHLVQFAMLGASYWHTKGIEKPIVGLLNIGHEEIKGTSELRLAYQELKNYTNPPFHFSGNIEAKSAFDGKVDVLVTDGFTGNIFLKTSEGIANLILDQVSQAQKITPQMEHLQKNLHYAKYPGARLVGVQKTVVKCHGYTPPDAYINAILGMIPSSLPVPVPMPFPKNL